MRRFLLSLLILAWLAPAYGDDKLSLTSEEGAPYNMTVNGKFAGIATDKIEELMRRTRVSYELRVLPWARAYQAALSESGTCVFATTRTPDREHSFQWIGPLGTVTWTLYGLANRDWRLPDLEAARPLRIGTYHGDSRDAFLRARGFQVDASNHDYANLEKLLLGRIDVWASSDIGAGQLIKDRNLTDKVKPLLTFHKVELYLACNPGVSTELVTRLQAGLRAMQADGSSAAIEKRYANILGR